jgi:hypothetical protein
MITGSGDPNHIQLHSHEPGNRKYFVQKIELSEVKLFMDAGVLDHIKILYIGLGAVGGGALLT